MADGKPARRWKRALGYGLVAFGVLSIIDFFSPIPIPTTGMSAILSGTLFIIGGAYFLSGGGWLAYLRRWAATRDKSPSRTKPQLADPLLPVEILRLASNRRGELTVSTVAMELNVPLDQAAAGLDECVRRGNALVDYDMDRLHATYRFPEFTPRD